MFAQGRVRGSEDCCWGQSKALSRSHGLHAWCVPDTGTAAGQDRAAWTVGCGYVWLATESGSFSQFFVSSRIWRCGRWRRSRCLISAPRVLIVQRDYCVYVFKTLSWTDVLLNMYCAYFLKSIQMRFLCYLNSSVAFNGALFSKGVNVIPEFLEKRDFLSFTWEWSLATSSSRGRYNSGDEAAKVAHWCIYFLKNMEAVEMLYTFSEKAYSICVNKC